MNFLIIKTSSIGDIIHTFPVVEYLKTRFPGCSCDWIVEEEYAPLLKAHPNVNEVLTIATRKWRRSWFQKNSYTELRQAMTRLKNKSYDVIFDLQGNTKSAVLTYFAKGNQKVGYGWTSTPEWPHYLATDVKFNVNESLPIQMRYLSMIQQFYNDTAPFEFGKGIELLLSSEEEKQLHELNSSKIMVACSSKWSNKCLTIQQWVALLKQYQPPFYFVCGTNREKEMAEEIAAHFPGSEVLQNLSFPLWQRLMGKMDLVIAVDSAALALCGTTSTASFSFFGPTQASVYKPLGEQHTHVQGVCPYGVEFTARCTKLRTCKTGACLKNQALISVDP